jgi:hypothetical protein
MLLQAGMQIEELMARQRIADVIHAYCLHVDRNEPKKVAALFSTDCVVDYGPGLGGPIDGAEALAAALAPGLARFEATHHQVSNIQLAFESRNRATGLTYVTAWHRFPGDTPDATLYGQYHDVFVRTHGQWQIAERRLRASGQTGFDIAWTPIGRR